MAQGIFFFVGICSLFGSGILFVESKSAIHEIESMVLALIGWMLIVGGVIDLRLSQIRDRIPARRQPMAREAPPPAPPETRLPTKPVSQMTLKELLEAEKDVS